MSPDDLFKRLRKRKPKPAVQVPEGAPGEGSKEVVEGAIERCINEKRPSLHPELAQLVEQRRRRLAESFLDNEALTENLDDQAARALIDWSMDLARRVAERTQDLPADQAEAQVEQRGEAARRLIRAARDLALASPAASAAGSTRGLPQDAAPPEIRAQKPPEAPLAEAGSPVSSLGPDVEAFQRVARYAQEVYGADVPAGQPRALPERLRQAGDLPVERIAALRALLESSTADQDLPFWHSDEKDRDW